MNAASLHLLVNHAPLFLSAVAVVLLVPALLRRNVTLLSAAVWLVIGAGVAAVLAQQSGEAAEHLLEHMPGVAKTAIEAHEEAARTTLIVALVSAGIALGVLLGRRWWSQRLQWGFAVLLLISSLALFASSAYTSHRGGLIRHADELENRLPSPPPDEQD